VSLDARAVLADLPTGLRDELITEYTKIETNYTRCHWEASELDGGRFAEVAYTILDGFLGGGAYAQTTSKPQNFEQACRNLGNRPNSFPKSARVTVPRVLVALYDIRNNRGVGHVGGDVSANHMDAEFVLHSAQWVMAEFVRLFHGVDIATATAVVDVLVDRATPLIWQVGTVKRILVKGLSLADQTLLLLYSTTEDLTDRSLAEYLEQERLSNFKRVLQRLHGERQVEYQKQTGLVVLSPLGIERAERLIASQIS
jgi:hypothetical protein